MVRFNMKLIQQGSFAGEADNDTIDEGASIHAEELTGYSLTAPGGGNTFMFQAANAYLGAASTFNLFGDFNGSLKFYGGGYLLVKYFHEAFGDNAFIQFNTNTAIGYQNMVNVSGLSSSELFRRFSLALLASPFTGAVPAEARFGSGFTTEDTFDIRTLGQVSLQGLQPAQVFNPPSNAGAVDVKAFSPTLVRYQGGSGNDLIVEGTVNGFLTIQSVFETALENVAFTDVNTIDSGGFAREDTEGSADDTSDNTQASAYTNPVAPIPDSFKWKVDGIFPSSR